MEDNKVQPDLENAGYTELSKEEYQILKAPNIFTCKFLNYVKIVSIILLNFLIGLGMDLNTVSEQNNRT